VVARASPSLLREAAGMRRAGHLTRYWKDTRRCLRFRNPSPRVLWSRWGNDRVIPGAGIETGVPGDRPGHRLRELERVLGRGQGDAIQDSLAARRFRIKASERVARFRNHLARSEKHLLAGVVGGRISARLGACAVLWHDMHAEMGLSTGPFSRPSTPKWAFAYAGAPGLIHDSFIGWPLGSFPHIRPTGTIFNQGELPAIERS
jgi:hypothetical protein